MNYRECDIHSYCESPGMCINRRALDNVRSEPLDTVVWKYRQGLISTYVWEAYAHLWQTSAPRFEIRVCDCESCRVTYSHLRNEVQS